MSESERFTVQIPKNTEVYKYLFEGKNHKDMAKWEIIEEMVKQLPKSKQERSLKAFHTFIEEMANLYPGSDERLNFLWALIARRALRIPGIDGKEQFLDDFYYSELKKL